jgi:wobble nucleotide-excising tRNase
VAGSAREHVFENGAWSASDDQIVVFDDAFVAQNVCCGIEIASEHCKNLHELIIGRWGVALNETHQQHVKKIEEHNVELRALGGNISGSARGALNVDQFCALEKRDDIDAVIADTERKISAVKDADDIQRREPVKSFMLPAFDIDELNGLLSRGLPELEADAAQKVRDHLSHAGRNAETWVAEGLPRVTEMADATGQNDCPFCAQDLSSSPVIRHYKAYFSDAYAKLREDVTEAGKALNRDFGGDIAAAYERAIAAISASRNFWGRFADIPEQEFDTAATVRALNVAREAVRQRLLAKHAAPFEIAPLSEETLNAIGAYDALRQRHIEAMRVCEEANAKIAPIKEQAASSNLSALQTDLDSLKRIKVRHSDPYDEICRKYLEAVEEKQKTERARDAAREDLNQYQLQVFPQYEAAINDYLGKFHAGYRLGSVSSRNTRSGATCDYKVLINNVSVSLSTNAGPSFRNTLSAGDRNTLALAFFFASLEQDSDLVSKIVVIDDPMTSLDEHRSLTTRQEIITLTGRVAQVIVMSHEKRFLCALWEAASRIDRAAIMVMRDGDGSGSSWVDVRPRVAGAASAAFGWSVF